MCKVLMVPGIKKQHQDKVKKLAKAFVKAAAKVDDDGFGYAGITSRGEIYGEKWLNEKDAFVLHSDPKPPAPGPVEELLGPAARASTFFTADKVYGAFGVERTKEVQNDTVAMIVHARRKTHGLKSIENTHPFYEPATEQDPATALIHNGSIVNHYNLTKKYSTCDSEAILHEYLKNAMSFNPWAVPELAKTLVGQYTVGVLTSTFDNENNAIPVLDIFKSTKELHCAYVKELGTFVFCTTVEILREACKSVKMTPSNITEVRDGYLLRLDATTGMRLEDPIPFDLSRQYTTMGNQTYTGGGANNYNYDRNDRGYLGPAHNTTHTQRTVKEDNDSVEDAKEAFTRRHTELFALPYYDVMAGLSKEEIEFYESLEVDKNVDKRALKLVRKVLNF